MDPQQSVLCFCSGTAKKDSIGLILGLLCIDTMCAYCNVYMHHGEHSVYLFEEEEFYGILDLEASFFLYPLGHLLLDRCPLDSTYTTRL